MAAELQHPLSLPLHLATLYLTLLPPPSALRRHASIFLILLTYLPLTLHPISADPAAAYGAATLWVLTLRVLTIHVFHAVPERDLYRPHLEPAGAALSYPLHEKAGWAFSLLTSLRNVGWNNCVPLPASAAPRSRQRFALRAAGRVAGLYLLLDLSRTWMVQQPYCGFPRGNLPSQQPLRRRAGDLAANGISAAGYMALQYELLSLLAVGVFGQAPELWAPLFGDLALCWSVSNLWGKVWHSMLRAGTVPWGRALADWAGVKGRKRYALLVAIAFAISAAGHAVAVHTVAPAKGGGAVRFFGMQALGIGIEGAVARLWRAVGGGGGGAGAATKMLGFVWTLAWLGFTCPLQADEMVEIGLFEKEAVPFSVVRWALGWQP
ncbi:hypothetical protein FN846DRAFT_943164 [Sphaerosporella brunnea]|uniref:Wax synthase domain-containing protein n=1 Tax=Sphaerosporella brunnea TaxID=1250544 RepID=A0A5J5F062_9PEZI|nr:hypothetical protein FN846DRAFT_943164 [Sphaerosporella brunnea]